MTGCWKNTFPLSQFPYIKIIVCQEESANGEILGGGRFSNLPLIQAVGFENPTAHKLIE